MSRLTRFCAVLLAAAGLSAQSDRALTRNRSAHRNRLRKAWRTATCTRSRPSWPRRPSSRLERVFRGKKEVAAAGSGSSRVPGAFFLGTCAGPGSGLRNPGALHGLCATGPASASEPSTPSGAARRREVEDRHRQWLSAVRLHVQVAGRGPQRGGPRELLARRAAGDAQDLRGAPPAIRVNRCNRVSAGMAGTVRWRRLESEGDPMFRSFLAIAVLFAATSWALTRPVRPVR